jgi:hypothetical protein
MRSVPAGSFERIADPVALWRAWTRCRRGRRRRGDIARFDVDADRRVFALARALRAGDWRPSPLRLCRVHDPKARCVAVASIADRIVQQALVHELEPHYARSFSDQSFGCGAGRGPHRALLCALRYARRHRWRAAVDVACYFASVSHDRLLALYAHCLHDERTLGLLEAILAAGAAAYAVAWVREIVGPVPARTGLPIGSYLSHFSGALYLDGLDHHLRRELHVPGHIRYMDDVVLFHDDRAALEGAVEAMREWLRRERGLSLKPGGSVCSTREPMRLLGWRLNRSGLVPSPKLTRNLRRSIEDAAARGPGAMERTVVAWRGLVEF